MKLKPWREYSRHGLNSAKEERAIRDYYEVPLVISDRPLLYVLAVLLGNVPAAVGNIIQIVQTK
jgi:hypothetical protein